MNRSISHSSLAWVLVCLTSALSSAESPGTWNQWRGPDRDGSLSDQSWPESLNGKLSLAWERKHQPSYSGPVATGDLVFTTETIDRQTERVTAYSISSGEVRWTREWPGSMAVKFFAASNGDWIRATPV